jgi:hypothetical protein
MSLPTQEPTSRNCETSHTCEIHNYRQHRKSPSLRTWSVQTTGTKYTRSVQQQRPKTTDAVHLSSSEKTSLLHTLRKLSQNCTRTSSQAKQESAITGPAVSLYHLIQSFVLQNHVVVVLWRGSCGGNYGAEVAMASAIAAKEWSGGAMGEWEGRPRIRRGWTLGMIPGTVNTRNGWYPRKAQVRAKNGTEAVGPGLLLGFFFQAFKSQKATKKWIPFYKRYKEDKIFFGWKYNENRRNFYFTSIMWMNVEIFCFIAIFYVASLASPQIWKKKP